MLCSYLQYWLVYLPNLVIFLLYDPLLNKRRRKDNLPERCLTAQDFLPSMERVFHEVQVQALLALTPEQLARNPHLYLQRLLTIPQLPPPRPEPTQQPPAATILTIPQVEWVDVTFADEPDKTPPEPRYPTPWGEITFDEIYAHSHRYAEYLLRYKFYRAVEDDCLQVGYLKLWKRLQQDPDFLMDRKEGWVARFLFWASLYTQHREHITQQRHHSGIQDEEYSPSMTIELGTKKSRAHSHESRQTDQRIDLQAAVVATANQILAQPPGTKQDRELWALYGLTALHVHAGEIATMFPVNRRDMYYAYREVRDMLQGKLANYKPLEPTRTHRRGPPALPAQDMMIIRQQNAHAKPEHFEQVRQILQKEQPDTIERDLLVLGAIQAKISARTFARSHGFSGSSMDRAFTRIHLLLGSILDPSVRPNRMVKTTKIEFVFTPEHTPRLQQVAEELLKKPNHQTWLVALYAYICNLPTRVVSRDFKIAESQVRKYRHQVHHLLGQPPEEKKI